MDEPYSPRQKSGIFRFGSGQSHLDDSKIGSILSNSGGGANSPCTRGKTMREFEAELADLKQENFELKMKIYVLEEQKSVMGDHRDVSELKMAQQQTQKELEKVKSELAEKEDLIFKAGEAMMLMSKKHEEDITSLHSQAQAELEEYRETIARLEGEIIEMKEKSMMCQRPAVFEDSSAMYAVAFNLPGNRPKALSPESQKEDKILELEDQLRSKSSDYDEMTVKCSTMKLEIDRLRTAEENLKAELEFRVQKLSDALSNLASSEKQIQDLKSRLEERDLSNSDIPADYQQLQKQYAATKTENQKLQDQVLKLHQRITELEKYNAVDLHKKIDALIKENVDLQEKVERIKEEGLVGGPDMSGHDKLLSDTDSRVRELEEELEKTKLELADVKSERTKTMKTIQAFVKQNRALTRDIERLQQQQQGEYKPSEKCDVTPEPKKEGMEELLKDFEDKEKADFDCNDPEKSYLYSALEANKQQVDQLKEKLRKRTIDLQELVNKELWSKNKEIEKLNRLCEKQVKDWSDQRAKLKSQETEIKSLNEEIDRLRKMLEKTGEDRDGEKNNAEEPVLKMELERVKLQLEEEIERNQELSSRCEKLKLEAEGWEKSRKDLVAACRLLTTRLEELSSFLESLLPSLAGRRRRLVKEAIDMSREVSKSLSLSCLDESALQSLSISQPILPDVSQVDFNSEDDPEDTLHPSSDALDDNKNEMMRIRSEMDGLVKRLKEASPEKKHLLKKSPLSPWSLSSTLQEVKDFSSQAFDDSAFFGEAIPAIALEDITEGTGIESFETDTDIKNIPEDLFTPKKHSKQNSAICAGSESEGWSEPDRTVSMARIGLKEETPPARGAESDSSEAVMKMTNSSVKKRRDSEIKSLHMKIRSLEMTIDSLVSDGKSKASNGTLNTHNVSVDCQLLGENTLTQNLMADLMDQREKLMLSLNQNEVIRQRLEALSSSPSSPTTPTKSDPDKSKSFYQQEDLIKQVMNMADKLEESCSLCSQLESKCMELEKQKATFESEKASLVQMLTASEDKNNSLSTELNSLRCQLKEKENDLLEKHCSLLELKNSVIILESKVKLSQEEATKQSKLLESFTQESNAKVTELKEKWEKERADLINYYENEICVLKMRLKEIEVEVEKLRGEKDLVEGELKIRLDRVEREKRETLERRAEVEGRLKEALRAQVELQAALDNEGARIAEMEVSAKHSERVWRRRLALLENSTQETEARLRRKLDQLTLSSSETVIERTRIANERLTLQRHHAEVKSELEKRVVELELANQELESKLAALSSADSAPTSPKADYKRQRSNPTSDYVSDHDHHSIWFPVCGRSNDNSSPDLGIESDNRMSSLEHPLSSSKTNGENGGRKLEAENSELRAQLARTRKALEDTLAQLSSANQRKRQVEKAICRQLHKTHDILQKARLNLEPSEKNKF